MNLAEEVGYHDGFFPQEIEDGGNGIGGEDGGRTPDLTHSNEYLLSSSPPVHAEGDGGGMGMGIDGMGMEEAMRFRLPVNDGDQGVAGGEGMSVSPEDPFVGAVMESAEGRSVDMLGEGQLVDVGPETREEDVSPSSSTGTEMEREQETSPTETIRAPDSPTEEEARQVESNFQTSSNNEIAQTQSQPRKRSSSSAAAVAAASKVAEVVFFDYGVTVFFGLTEQEERDVLEDCQSAGCWGRSLDESDWEVEECHYVSLTTFILPSNYDFMASRVEEEVFILTSTLHSQVYDPDADYPRIYNDMFTFTSSSHLLKLSVSHAIAQSTKLSVYETVMQESLSSTSSFPKELATTGHLSLGRKEALKMTGRLFRLRMDVNLSSGILGAYHYSDCLFRCVS